MIDYTKKMLEQGLKKRWIGTYLNKDGNQYECECYGTTWFYARQDAMRRHGLTDFGQVLNLQQSDEPLRTENLEPLNEPAAATEENPSAPEPSSEPRYGC